jgi:branched-chain amino acid transport system permease protein
MINRESGVFKTTYQADMAFFRVPLARWTIGVILALTAVIPFLVNTYFPSSAEYWIRAIILPFMIFTIAAIGLNLLTGYCGQISLGHAAFTMVGGYTATIFSIYHVPFLLCVILGGLNAALVGLLFGIPSARIKGLYLAMATLAAQFTLPWVISRVTPLVVPTGLAVAGGDTVYPPASYIFGWQIKTNLDKYYVALFFLILLTVFAMNLVRSRVGRAWVAIRDHDVAARILGFDITYYKLLAFAISSFYAGVAGALLVFLFLGVAHVGEFGLILSVQLLAMVLIGGLGSILGNFFGVAFFLLLPIFLNQMVTPLGEIAGIRVSIGITSGVEILIFGTLVIVFLVVEPLGLAKLWGNFKDYFRLWPFSY